jgi:cell division protein FtsI/penicillin-binding protein 2
VQFETITETSESTRTGEMQLLANRGNIYLKDFHSDQKFYLATNTTFGRIIADPTLITTPQTIVEKLTPVLFNLEKEKEENINYINDIKKSIQKEQLEKNNVRLTPFSDEELLNNYKKELLEKITKKTREQIILTNKNFPEKIAEQVNQLNLSGIEAREDLLLAYPDLISDTPKTSGYLAPLLNINPERLSTILEGKNRYVVLDKKADANIIEAITSIKNEYKYGDGETFLGIKIEPVNYRYYPEQELAAQLVGFVDNAGNGQYGIEEKFNSLLKGKHGTFLTKKDAFGKQLTVGESIINPAEDGYDYTLTIDRSIQLKTEVLLKQTVIDTRADAGMVIVMEPNTGKIVSIAHYPTFNPNSFSDAYIKETIVINDQEKDSLVDIKEGQNYTKYLIINKDTDEKLQIFENKDEFGNDIYQKYKNNYGPVVYRNRSVSDIYEPGSVFKVVAMAAAIDDNDVTPSSTYNDKGPIEVDEFEIKNSEGKYYGIVNMTNILEKSLNTGMAYVARQMGRSLFYSYITRFGFNDLTYIEFQNEHAGLLKPGKRWADSELITHSFGQGISVTPIQMMTAFSSIINGGILMQPYIVDEYTKSNGKTYKTEPKVIRRTISQETSETLKSMLASAIENGVASPAQVKTHYVGGKTGTSQTYKNGKPLSGAGTTITSFAGFGPIEEPKFAVLIKLDLPRSSEWGAKTAAPLFSKLAEFLYHYYNIPPDKK